MSVPERIYISKHVGSPVFYESPLSGRIEYIRADIPKAERKELASALSQCDYYFQHTPSCRGVGPYMKDCDCGLPEFWKRVNELLAKHAGGAK